LQGGTLSPIDQTLTFEAVPITFFVALHNFDQQTSPTSLAVSPSSPGVASPYNPSIHFAW
jgi:hypothetical protein